MATRMQQRRGTASQWTSANPVLNAGEMGWESDTNKFKIGDGTNHWNDLDYFADINSTVNPAFGTSITFEGATADSYETTLQVTDPTADRTITLPNVTGTVITTGNLSDITDIGVFTSTITMEGSTADAFELTLSAGDPTADRTITFPDATGTVALTSDIAELSQDAIDTALTAGTGITKTYNDVANTLTLAVDTTTIQARVTDVSDTEIGYLNGVTSAIQTQLNDKLASATASTTYAPLANPTFTGTVTLPANTISQSMMSDDSVGTNEIGGLAVTTGKIADLAVTEGKIADGAVTSTKIANDTIVNADINSAAAIAQSKIADLTTDLAAKAALSGATFTGAISGTSLTLSGDLTVNGTTTTLNSTTLAIDDKNIILGDVATPTDTTADGGGITLKGATDKTFNWLDSTDSWTSSEHLTLNATKEFRLADTDSTHYVGFKAPGTVSANKIWTLPSEDGTANQVLKTDGSGTLSWATAGGGGASFSELLLIGA